MRRKVGGTVPQARRRPAACPRRSPHLSQLVAPRVSRQYSNQHAHATQYWSQYAHACQDKDEYAPTHSRGIMISQRAHALRQYNHGYADTRRGARDSG
eukprot:1276672-Rhodomonas_salina.3